MVDVIPDIDELRPSTGLTRKLDGKVTDTITHTRAQLLIPEPWNAADILDVPSLAHLGSLDLSNDQRKMLLFDAMAESDAQNLFDYIREIHPSLPEEVLSIFARWIQDEQNHAKGFIAINKAIGNSTPIRPYQNPNFSKLDHILKDPFIMLVALAIDEIASVFGYKNDMHQYAPMGEAVVKFVKKTTADEAWHFKKFTYLAARYFPERINDLTRALDVVMGLEGDKYEGTFFGDREPGKGKKFTDEQKAKAREQTERMILLHAQTL